MLQVMSALHGVGAAADGEFDALFNTNWLRMTLPRPLSAARSGVGRDTGEWGRDWLSLLQVLLTLENRPRMASHLAALSVGGADRVGERERRKVLGSLVAVRGAAASAAAVLAGVVPGSAIWLSGRHVCVCECECECVCEKEEATERERERGRDEGGGGRSESDTHTHTHTNPLSGVCSGASHTHTHTHTFGVNFHMKNSENP